MEPLNQTEDTTPAETSTPGTDIFELVYQGPDVDDGTMNARELVEVLTGLTRAFSTVAHDRELANKYKLRIKDIGANSVHLIFEVVAFAKAYPGATAALAGVASVLMTGASNALSGAYRVITDLAKVIDAK